MKFSIITPTNNSEKTIIRNAQSIISQTYKNFEHILIDNLSKDRTIYNIKNIYEEAGLSSKLRVISEKDSGISDAFNKGILHSECDLIGILNSDDYFYDEFVLEKALKEFAEKNILFVHGNIFFNDNMYGSNLRKPLLCPITEAMPYNHPTMFFRKYVYENYGMFDTKYKYAMDFEFVCRLEKTVPGFRDKGKYIEGDALVFMSAGGKSWEYEIESVREVKQALQFHKLWDANAYFSYSFRMFRIELKKLLSKLKLNSLVYLWRVNKWNRHK
jgi:glycosyltransferase involved in cell wall biosynthesis